MHVRIPHKTTKKDAMNRVAQALTQVRQNLGGQLQDFKVDWAGDTLNFSFKIQKKEISGVLVVDDEAFDITAKLPLLWRMFEGQIEKAIDQQVKDMVAGKLPPGMQMPRR